MWNYSFAQTAKTWVSLIGTILTVVVPSLLSVAESLPTPWPAVVAGIMAVLTALGVYKVPNADSSIPVSGKKSVKGHEGYDFPWPKG